MANCYDGLELMLKAYRKPEKKRYAIAYFRYVAGFTRVEPVYEGKSYMAAQAIRMNIHDLLKSNER